MTKVVNTIASIYHFTFPNKRGWKWYASSPGNSMVTLSWISIKDKRSRHVSKTQETIEIKNGMSSTARSCNSYYLFTKVNNNAVSWYALCKYRYHHFFWFLIKFMPAEYLKRKSWKKIELGRMAPTSMKSSWLLTSATT